jgi:hypothetical protein
MANDAHDPQVSGQRLKRLDTVLELSNMPRTQRKAAGFPAASFESAICFCIYPGPQREDGVVKVFWNVY